MRTLQILLSLALVAYLARGASYGGLSSITIYGNEDPGACTLTLSLALQEDKVVFTETVYNPNWTCTFQNLQFAPVFRGDALGGNVTLSQVGGGSTFTGALTLAQIASVNGSYCGNLGDNGQGADFWACRFKYGQIYFQIAVFVNKASGKIEINWTDLLFPNYGTTNVTSANGTNLLRPSNAFPDLVARLPNGYFSWNNTIPDLQWPIYVIGTVQLSNQVNLTTYFSDFVLNAILVKKTDQSYFVYKTPIVFYPFSPVKQGPNNATHIGLIWSQPLETINDCLNGCQVSFVLQKDAQVYILQTSGVVTKPPAGNLRA